MYTFTITLIVTLTFSNCASGSSKYKESASTFEVDYEWTFINFTWESEAAYLDAISSGKYIPENNVMAGIKYYKDKFYIAMPRIRNGTPVTLGYISVHDGTPKTNPLITPYPDWDTHNLDCCCNKLESVQSMEIDAEGIMWVIDGHRTKPNSICPPKLVLYDLNNNGKVVQNFIFPEAVCLSKGGFLNDIVVDNHDGGFAYITDHSTIDPGLIVYSRKRNRAWKLRDVRSMSGEIKGANFEVDGLITRGLLPIDGIALSPCDGTNPRRVYYCALAGLSLYSINTEFLKNEEAASRGDWRSNVTYIGEKQAQSDGMVIDNKGNLYYGLLPLYGVGNWNIYKDFSEAQIVDQNRKTMIWTDSFAFDDKGYLYLVVNHINRYFDPTYKLQLTDEVKFRILKYFTSTLSYLY